jgi:ankyrin repeat protein
LLYACSRNRREIALILLREGADPNLADKLGACPLHRAVGCGHAELTRLILNNANNLDVNKTDGYLNTSLHYAFEEGFSEICKILINHGAKNDIRNKQGLTPLEMAKPELQRSFRELLNSS